MYTDETEWAPHILILRLHYRSVWKHTYSPIQCIVAAFMFTCITASSLSHYCINGSALGIITLHVNLNLPLQACSGSPLNVLHYIFDQLLYIYFNRVPVTTSKDENTTKESEIW